MANNIKSTHGYLPFSRWNVTRSNFHGGRLTCSIWTKESNDLTLTHFKRNVVYSLLAAVYLGEVFNKNGHALYKSPALREGTKLKKFMIYRLDLSHWSLSYNLAY